ncbi:MAG: 4-hydroxy-3-methylbut-2-enyl diphosphate reductase [Deltaproteobacteria bacterium]|nr:4-hydroxy-3-methylbut-2-enyl diphosphate reductase [Deltaproteobacteria bacterium]MBW2723094.1 4-hydroxy-3-methylbut-2-enyl diphosphate reductase [Deltaproteobacteria bacterium]
MEILLANPRGFCAGVDRAIEIVERALERHGPPVYVRHEIVHNRHVVDALRKKGAVFIESPSEAPPGAQLIFSAHGVSPQVRDEAAQHELHTIDATCPLVTKVHFEVQRMVARGYEIIMIGHAGHVEVEGTMGQEPGQMYLVETVEDVQKLEVRNPERLGCVTQTTLSVDDTAVVMESLKQRFPAILLPKRDDICYATQNRQDAVKTLAEKADLVLIVGAPASSNSNRLVEVAAKRGIHSVLIENASDIVPEWLDGVECVGVSAGASTPEFLIEKVIDRLKALHGADVEVNSLVEVDEGMTFKLPQELRD